MTDHKFGEMDTSVHESTFTGFIKVSKFVAGLSIAVLIFMALVNS